MANRYWVASGAGNWNDTANWSASSGGGGGASVPGVSDDVIFDGSGVGNAITDIAINIASLDVQSGYSGTLDFADLSYSHTIGLGGLSGAGTGEIDLGDATISVSGDITLDAQNIVVRGTSTLVVDAAATLTLKQNGVYSLTINEDATSNARCYVYGTLTVASTKTLTLAHHIQIYTPSSDIDNNGTININVAGRYLDFRNGTGATNIGQVTGIGYIRFSGTGSTSLPANTFTVPVYFRGDQSRTIVSTGSLIFNDQVTIHSDASHSVTIDNSGNYNITFQDDVIWIENGTNTWIKGTGIITFSGSDNQSLDFGGSTIEDIVIDKTIGIATLIGGFTTDSLSVNRGELDINGQAVDVSGDMTSNPIAGAVIISDTAATGSISITGNIDLNGTGIYGITWTDADIDTLAAGINEADYTDVTNSNNSSGNDIVVTNGTVTNSPGWIIGGAPPPGRYMFRGPF